MRKWSICNLAAILILLIQNRSEAQEIELIKTTVLENYPSASSLEWYNKKLYVFGDDAPHMLILDQQHQVVDSIRLFRSEAARILKEEKADIEASAIFRDKNHDYLVGIGSFSDKKRNKIIVLDTKDNKFNILDASFELKALLEINIEGAAVVNNHMLLSNRANNTNRQNKLIVTEFDLEKGIKQEPLRLITVSLPKSKNVEGISGLNYIKTKDLLLFTVSTENTDNAYTDGDIGESFIGYIFDISQKLNEDEIQVDKLISLKKFFPTKAPQKIESIAVEKIEPDNLTIHLAADNDNGQSTLFKMRLRLASK